MNDTRKAMDSKAKAALLGLCCITGLFAACGDSTGSTGEVRVDLSGEEAAVEGYPVGSGEDQIAFADGFTLQFEKVLVAFERFELGTSAGDRADLEVDPIVADLHLGDPRGWVFGGVPSRRWDDVRYVYAAPTMQSRKVNDVSDDDLREMADNGYAIWVAGTATDGTESYDFDLRIPLRVTSEACQNGIDETDGLVVPNNGVVDAELTVHLDHFFFDTFATEEAQLRFEPWAAVAGEDGVITLEDLATQSLSDLRDRSGDPLLDEQDDPIVYDPGPLALSENNLREYVIAAATTTGHFNGEGHCDYVVE